MDLIITILPVVTKDLPISPRFTPYNFLSRCKFSTLLTTRQPMVEFYLLTFPRFPLRKKEHKSYFGKNRTHDFRTSRYMEIYTVCVLPEHILLYRPLAMSGNSLSFGAPLVDAVVLYVVGVTGVRCYQYGIAPLILSHQ